MRRPLLLLLLLTTGSARAASNDGGSWQFALQPYLLVTTISGDATVGRATGIPVDVSFSDILENLEMAAMLHFEARHTNGWGLMLDYGFMDLGADTSVGFGGVVDASVRQGILEALASRQLPVATGQLEVLAGVRWWDNRVRARFNPGIVSGSLRTAVSEDWVDPVLGLRWTQGLSDRWQLRLRGDLAAC